MPNKDKEKKSKKKTRVIEAAGVAAAMIISGLILFNGMAPIPGAAVYEENIILTVTGEDIRGVRFTSDSYWLVICEGTIYSGNYNVTIYNTTDWSTEQQLLFTQPALSAVFSHDDAYLAIGFGGTWDNCSIWWTSNWTQMGEITAAQIRGGDVRTIAWHPDGTHICPASNSDDDVMIYTFPGLDYLSITTGADSPYGPDDDAVLWSPDGTYFYVGNENGDVHKFTFNEDTSGDMALLDLIAMGAGSTGESANNMDITSDGNIMGYCIRDSIDDTVIGICNSSDNANDISIWAEHASYGQVQGFDFSSDMNYFAFGDTAVDKVRIFSLINFQEIAVLDMGSANPLFVRFSPDCTMIVAADDATDLYVWNMQNGTYSTPVDTGHYIMKNNATDWLLKARIPSMNEIYMSSNSSGSWVNFFSDASVGDLNKYDTSGSNTNWTEPFSQYWYNVSIYDGSTWYNYTKTFHTMGILGDMVRMVKDSTILNLNAMDKAVIQKNNSGAYIYVLSTGSQMWTWNSSNGIDWIERPFTEYIGAYDQIRTILCNDTGTWIWIEEGSSVDYYCTYNNVTKTFGSAAAAAFTDVANDNFDCIYYDNIWHFFDGDSRWYTGWPPTAWTYHQRLGDGSTAVGTDCSVYNGELYAFYDSPDLVEGGGDFLVWRIYNGTSWSSQIEPYGEANIRVTDGDGFATAYNPTYDAIEYIGGAGNILLYGVIKDGQQMNLTYITYPGTYEFDEFWGTEYDGRSVFSIVCRKDGWRLPYLIYSPGFVEQASGITEEDTVLWPNVETTDTNINSSVVELGNIDHRNITYITWHFEDIGTIDVNSNLEVWTNMSGVWTSIGTCDASGDISQLDISSLMAGGGEWESGDSTYWKFEILSFSGESEDTHVTDLGVWYKVEFT